MAEKSLTKQTILTMPIIALLRLETLRPTDLWVYGVMVLVWEYNGSCASHIAGGFLLNSPLISKPLNS